MKELDPEARQRAGLGAFDGNALLLLKRDEQLVTERRSLGTTEEGRKRNGYDHEGDPGLLPEHRNKLVKTSLNAELLVNTRVAFTTFARHAAGIRTCCC